MGAEHIELAEPDVGLDAGPGEAIFDDADDGGLCPAGVRERPERERALRPGCVWGRGRVAARSHHAEAGDLVRHRPVVVLEIIVLGPSGRPLDDTDGILKSAVVMRAGNGSPRFDAGIPVPQPERAGDRPEVRDVERQRAHFLEGVRERFRAGLDPADLQHERIAPRLVGRQPELHVGPVDGHGAGRPRNEDVAEERNARALRADEVDVDSAREIEVELHGVRGLQTGFRRDTHRNRRETRNRSRPHGLRPQLLPCWCAERRVGRRDELLFTERNAVAVVAEGDAERVQLRFHHVAGRARRLVTTRKDGNGQTRSYQPQYEPDNKAGAKRVLHQLVVPYP